MWQMSQFGLIFWLLSAPVCVYVFVSHSLLEAARGRMSLTGMCTIVEHEILQPNVSLLAQAHKIYSVYRSLPGLGTNSTQKVCFFVARFAALQK